MDCHKGVCIWDKYNNCLILTLKSIDTLKAQFSVYMIILCIGLKWQLAAMVVC